MKLYPGNLAEHANEKDIAHATSVKCVGKGITSVSGLDACTSLIRLDLSNNHLTNIDPIAALPNLKWLSIAKNNIKCIKALQSLSTLEVLNASHNELEGKVSVGRIAELRALVLSNNKIQTVGGLEKLRKLDTLILSHNNISSLGGWVAGAASLQKLSVSHNPLNVEAATAGLKNLTGMKELRMNHCQLSKVPSAVLCMKRLQILELGSNLINEFENLEVLASVQSMWQLNLKGCPVTQKDGYQNWILDLVPRVDVLDTKRIRPKGGKGKRARLADGDTQVQSLSKGKEIENPTVSETKVQEHVATAATVAPVYNSTMHTSQDEDSDCIEAEAFRPSKLSTGQKERSSRKRENTKSKKSKGLNKPNDASSKPKKDRKNDQGSKVSLRGKAAVLSADQKNVLSGWS